MFIKIDRANCITGQSTLLFTWMFKAQATLVFHLSVQIKNLSLSWNEIGNSGAKALAKCLRNVDELDLDDCDITECEELCNAIQSLKRPVSFNLVSRHTVLKFVWYARCVRWFAVNAVFVQNISRFNSSFIQLGLTLAWKCYFINQKQPTVERMCAAV